MDVKKYLQKLHGGEADHTTGTLFLPPDVHMGSEELVFQLCEDPFETKLKANYEVGMATAYLYLSRNTGNAGPLCFSIYM